MHAGTVPPPTLTAEDLAAFERGVEEFNAGLFFECHDTLEELWVGIRGPARDFFQGIIQVAVGFYHLGNGNLVGARRLFDRALRRLQPYPGHYGGLDLGALRRTVDAWRPASSGDSAPGTSSPEPPRLRRVASPGAAAVPPVAATDD